MTRELPRLGVVGLGKLGAPMVGVFAEAGFEVTGTDISVSAVDMLGKAIAPVDETDLQSYIDAGKDRIKVTYDTVDVGKTSDIIFIIVPTPSDENHCFSVEYVVDAIKNVGEGIRDSDDDKLVVVTSTVMPGATGGIIKETLENASGRELGEGLGLCYNPEFIALGSVIANMHYPDFILIGESAPKWGDLLQGVYRIACRNTPVFERMNFVNAEITKIAVNTFTTTKISYANMLSEICEKLEGADSDVVSNAVGSDSRVGKKYLKGGVGYGGPCFPRDNKAFIALAESIGANAALAKATDDINDYQLARYKAALKRYVGENEVIGIVGLAYKNNTHVTEASQGWYTAVMAAQEGYSIVVYDPNVKNVPDGCRGVESLDEVLKSVNTVILMLPDVGFSEHVTSFLKKNPKHLTIIDPWRSSRKLHENQSVDYIALGLGA